MTVAYSSAMCWADNKTLLFAALLLIAIVSFSARNSGDVTGSKQSQQGMTEGGVHPATRPISLAAVALIGPQFNYDFDSDSQGQTPAKFHAARTDAGQESRWLVMNDPAAPSRPNVVAQTSVDQTDYRFSLLIADDASFRDLDLPVKFKAVSGNIDRAAGLAFRLQDPNNYYVVRANALENSYNLYRVVNGHRSQFAGSA